MGKGEDQEERDGGCLLAGAAFIPSRGASEKTYAFNTGTSHRAALLHIDIWILDVLFARCLDGATNGNLGVMFSTAIG